MNLQETKVEIENILKGIDGVINKLPIIQKGQVITQKKILKDILLLSDKEEANFVLQENEIEMIMDFKKLILASQDFEVINKERERTNYVDSVKDWKASHDNEYIKLSEELMDLFQEAYSKYTAVAA